MLRKSKIWCNRPICKEIGISIICIESAVPYGYVITASHSISDHLATPVTTHLLLVVDCVRDIIRLFNCLVPQYFKRTTPNQILRSLFSSKSDVFWAKQKKYPTSIGLVTPPFWWMRLTKHQKLPQKKGWTWSFPSKLDHQDACNVPLEVAFFLERETAPFSWLVPRELMALEPSYRWALAPESMLDHSDQKSKVSASFLAGTSDFKASCQGTFLKLWSGKIQCVLIATRKPSWTSHDHHDDAQCDSVRSAQAFGGISTL